MQYLLLAMAVTIGLLYIPYLIAILLGKPGSFETRAILSLAVWIREMGPRSKRYLETIYFATAFIEVIYFILALMVIRNVFLFWFTVAFIGFELLHFFMEVLNLRHFFNGNLAIKDILYWRYERLSCLLFCLHTILLIFSFIIFA